MYGYFPRTFTFTSKYSLETQPGELKLPETVSDHSTCGKILDDTTTAVQHDLNSHLRLPTTSWHGRSSFDKHRFPYDKQRQRPTIRGKVRHNLIFTSCTDHEIDISTAPSSPMHLLRKPRATRQILNCACNLAKHGMCISVRQPRTNVTINSGHALSKHTLGDKPTAVAASDTVSALRKNPQAVESKCSKFRKTENQQLRIREPLQTTT